MSSPVPAPDPSEHPQWKEAYQLAILESDSARLASLIEAAKVAIAARIVELRELPSLEGQTCELDSITHALQVLRLLAEHAPLRKTMVL